MNNYLRRLDQALPSGQWRSDVRGGLQAAVVSMPLALAFGVLSGAGPVAGFYGAICVGFLAALAGGTRAQISGPTGPTALVLAAVFTSFPGEPAKVFTVVMLAGLAQVAFGALRMGKYTYLLPYPVISGWASGIGTVIIIMQLAPLMGHAPLTHPSQALLHLGKDLDQANMDALAVGMVSLFAALASPARYRKLVPPHLLALLVGTLCGALLFTDAPTLGPLPSVLPDVQAPTFTQKDMNTMLFAALASPTRYRKLVPPHLLALLVGTLCGALLFTDAPTLGPLPSVLPDVQAPTLTQKDMNTMLFAALSIALLGSIDSLLASMAADSKTHTYHNSDRELLGQGLGNLLAGLMGAVPGAGATVRTMTNIQWGGRTRLSGVVCSGALLLTLLALGPLLSRIPVAALAGILVKVALDIIDWRYLKRFRTAPRTGLTLMFTVMGLTVVFNLVLAVAVGVVVASLLFVKRMADVELEGVKTFDNPRGEASLSHSEAAAMEQLDGRAMIIRFSGPMSFGAANRLHRRLAGYENYEVLLLDLREVPSIDSSATMALENIINNAREDNHTVILVGLNTAVARRFASLGVLDLIREVERYPDLLQALEYAAGLLEPGSAEAPAWR